MNYDTVPTAINRVLRGDSDVSLTVFETGIINHPGWATPIVALARSAEKIEDWESAFALWTQARRVIPHSEQVRDGVRRVAIRLMESRFPERHSNTARISTFESVATTEDKPVRDLSETIDSEPVVDKLESTERPPIEPLPLVQPFDFDLTEFEVTQPEVENKESGETLDELDQLIDRLEGARIVPREDVRSIPVANLEDDIGDVASETLATIYMDQEQYSEAARVFESLAEQQPDRADEFRTMAEDARAKLSN